MNSYGLTQKIDEITHRNRHILDHICSNDYQINLSIKVCNDTQGLITDYFPIVIQLSSTATLNTSEIKELRKLNNIDMDKFRQDLSSAYGHINCNIFGTKVKQFDSFLRRIMDKHALLRTKSLKNLDLHGLTHSIRQKEQREGSMKRHGTD